MFPMLKAPRTSAFKVGEGSMNDNGALQRLEQPRLYEIERRRAEELAAINLVVTVANETPQLQRMLDRILRAVVAVLDMEAGGIYLLDERTDTLVLKSWLGVDESFAEGVDHLKIGEGFCGQAFASGESIASEDVCQDPRLSREVVRDAGLCAAAFVPLRAKERKLGVLWVASRQKRPIPSEDVKLLETLAGQMALAIENALLLEEARKRARELALLNEVSLAITSVLDIDQVLTLIMSKASELLGAEAGSVLLRDGESGELVFSTCVGERSELLRGRRFPLDRGVAGWAVRRGEPALVADVSQDERFYEEFDAATGFHTRSLICAPLKVREKVIGVLEMVSKTEGNFSADDLRLLRALALPAAIAIE
ncbi:MAG TPA: GAF domain-containing protein, partial [Anaerolineae bacterium]|nr:GAF domain-containing protein [Anaerolineae bacterium]